MEKENFVEEEYIDTSETEKQEEAFNSWRDPLLEWSVLEHPYKEKTADWYWILTILAFGGAVAAILFGDVLFALVIAIGAFTIALYAGRRPNQIRVAITKRGIVHDQDLHLYPHIDSFWVEDRFGEPTLHFHCRKLLYPHMSVPLEDIDPELARDILINFLEEVEHHEPLIHRWATRLGF